VSVSALLQIEQLTGIVQYLILKSFQVDFGGFLFGVAFPSLIKADLLP
jgi:hypothetical protein